MKQSLRECLKIVNRFVRDPEMCRVLRLNFLSQAASQSHTSETWANTILFLNRTFGVGAPIDSFTLQIMETYKSVESSTTKDDNF